MSNTIEVEINIAGVDVTVSGWYSPEEPMVKYDSNMEGYPGCYSEFEIDSIQVNGTDITELVSDDVYNEIIEKVINNIEN
jgi:hypothetical protein